MVLAARFGPQRQLIGPAMFPFYWLALKIALGVGLLVHVVVAGRAARERPRGPGDRRPAGSLPHARRGLGLRLGDAGLRRRPAGADARGCLRGLAAADAAPGAGRGTARLTAPRALRAGGPAALLAWLLLLPPYSPLAMGPAAPLARLRAGLAALLRAAGAAGARLDGRARSLALVCPDRPRLRLVLRIAVTSSGWSCSACCSTAARGSS